MENNYLPYDDWDLRWSQFEAKKEQDKLASRLRFYTEKRLADLVQHNKLRKEYLQA